LILEYYGAIFTFSITGDNLNITIIIVVIIATITIIIIITTTTTTTTIVLPLDVQPLQIWYAVIQIYLVSKLDI